jgi:L-arabinonolactonase
MTEPIHIIEVQNLLGEGVLWDGREDAALWIDIEGARFWRWQAGHEAQSFKLPERPGSFALTDKPGTYLGAFENGFARFSPASGAFEMLAPVTRDTPHLRMNDGRVARDGTFWAGSMAEKDGIPLGSLWRYDGTDKATPFIHNIRIPNSLCWNRDGNVMYFADSPRNMIWAYAFDAQTGPVGAPGIFATTPSGVHPDGSCIDAEDHLWNAQWGGGEVVRYRPDGSVERRLKLPVSQPSCVAFGGKNLDLLFVTSARVDLSAEQLAAEPLAGALLVYDVGVTGLAETICKHG